jgi:hypothetical protein
VALRFDFSEGAELGSYQVQALPGGKRQRLLSLPLRVSTTRRPARVDRGRLPRLGAGAAERAVEHLDELGGEITVSAPALFPEAVRCVIERLEFSPADRRRRRHSGTHGVLTLVLRTTA